jgi:hypothetical protein
MRRRKREKEQKGGGRMEKGDRWRKEIKIKRDIGEKERKERKGEVM